MKIQLTKKESLDLFYNAICNGLSMFSGYGLELQYDSKEYKQSRSKLTDPCFEDVLIQMLKDGYKLTLLDIEGEGEYTRSIGIKDIYANVMKTPMDHLSDMINEEDDATTADVLIQTVFFNEIVFG